MISRTRSIDRRLVSGAPRAHQIRTELILGRQGGLNLHRCIAGDCLKWSRYRWWHRNNSFSFWRDDTIEVRRRGREIAPMSVLASLLTCSGTCTGRLHDISTGFRLCLQRRSATMYQWPPSVSEMNVSHFRVVAGAWDAVCLHLAALHSLSILSTLKYYGTSNACASSTAVILTTHQRKRPTVQTFAYGHKQPNWCALRTNTLSLIGWSSFALHTVVSIDTT